MIVFDAHVHYHDCFQQEVFFSAAAGNFNEVAQRLVPPTEEAVFCLLLAEMAGQEYFSSLVSVARSSQRLGDWIVEEREAGLSLQITQENSPRLSFLLAAGRQLVSAEGLEVLALMTPGALVEGQELGHLVDTILAAGGLAVCPWGAGKWLGTRGRLLQEYCKDHPSGFFLGDNGGRPGLWRQPELAARSAFLLSGSDPLPLKGEEQRVGSFGGIVSDRLDQNTPIQSLRKLLIDGTARVEPYGASAGLLEFARKQIALRMP